MGRRLRSCGGVAGPVDSLRRGGPGVTVFLAVLGAAPGSASPLTASGRPEH